MYAIIATGGKQYKVSEGDVIDVEKIAAEAGAEVTFDNVLAVGGETLKVAGDVAGATVTGTVMEQGKAKKVVVYRYKRKTGYHKKNGHRQLFTRVANNLAAIDIQYAIQIIIEIDWHIAGLKRSRRQRNRAGAAGQEQRVLNGNGHDSCRYFQRSRGALRIFRVRGSCR